MRPDLGGRIEPAAPPPPGLDPSTENAEPAPPRFAAPGPRGEPVFLPLVRTRLGNRGVLIFAVAMLLAAMAGLAYVVSE